jgi:hypothetical protein
MPHEETMSRPLGPPAALCVVVMVTAITAGCGGTGSGGTSSVAALPGARTSGGASTATTRKKAIQFARCMRAHGVSAFPDPNASGEMTIDGVANGSSVDTNSPVFRQALGACKGLEPPGFTGTKVTPQQATARLEFARCVRENGVPDFPDPAPNEPLVDTNRIPSASTPGGMSALNAAMKKCVRYASAAGVRGSR